MRANCTMSSDSVTVIIADNGKGLTEADQRKPGSFGLIGMRQRTATVGGELSISDLRGEGTAIEIRLPLVNLPN